jgi:hypothetical protein
MSDQNKSNFQALGAGLVGFVAVMAVGGGVLMLHSSHQAKSAATPAPAAAPIDLTSSMPRPSMSPSGMQKERRESSPAPLIGDDGSSSDESSASEATEPASAPSAPSAAPRAAAPSPESAPAAKASALEVARHLDAERNGSTAEAAVKNTVEEKNAPKPQSKLTGKKAPKLEVPAGDGAVASSVHYGVTNRSELMGRAAGPVYNFKGGKGGEAKAAAGKMADDADGRIADLRRQLEASGLPADQRAKLLKDLDESLKSISETGKTAQ